MAAIKRRRAALTVRQLVEDCEAYSHQFPSIKQKTSQLSRKLLRKLYMSIALFRIIL